MICVHCGKEFFEEWRKDKQTIRHKPLLYCSRQCANTRCHTSEQRKKTSKTLSEGFLSGRLSPWNKGKKTDLQQYTTFERERGPTSLLELSSRTVQKIVRRLGLGCSYPGCNWKIEGVVGDIHHIIPKKKGGTDEHSNLTYLCPNCHREVHAGVKDTSKLVTLVDHIGDRWKVLYFTKKQG